MAWKKLVRRPPAISSWGSLGALLSACNMSLDLEQYVFSASPPDAGSCGDAGDCSPPENQPESPEAGLPEGCAEGSREARCNRAPAARDDAFRAAIDAPLSVAAPGLLDNDSDPDGEAVSARAETLATALGGSVSIAQSGSFDYTPPRASVDPSAGDSFVYTIADGRGATATATARLDFVAAVLDRYPLTRGPASFAVDAAAGLLDNDVGGASVVAREGTTDRGGRFRVEPDGSFVYEPRSTVFWGDDAFSYTLTDGTLQTSGRVRLVVQPGLLDFDDFSTAQGHGFAVDTGLGGTSGNGIAAAGDVDGDALGDLILISGGQAYLIYGSSRSINIELALVGGSVPGVVFTSDETLTTVAGAGDVNGDGFDDVAIAGSSTAFVVFGGDDTNLDLDTLAAGTNPRGFAITGSSFGSGSRLAGAGDVDGDGRDDIIVGDPSFDGSRGRAAVVFGKSSATAVDIAGPLQGGFRINGIDFGELTGWSVAGAGDVNGDGLGDVIVGSHQSFTDGVSTGKAFVVFGKRDIGSVELEDLSNGAGAGFALIGAVRNDFVGHSVAAAGDVNGDGLEDVVVGAHFAYAQEGSSGPGGAFVVFGKTDAAPVFAADIQAARSGGFAVRGANPSDQVGYSVAGVGDVNGDGLADIAVAALNRGAYIVLGKPTTSTVALSTFPDFSLGAGILSSVNRSLIGAPVSGGGDIDGDGLSDVLVGGGASDPTGLTFYTLFGWDMSGSLAEREGSLRGGASDNAFDWPLRPPIAVRGGNGRDTLRVQGNGSVLDLTQRTPLLVSIEQIDLRGGGPQTLHLDDASVRRLPASRAGVPAPLAKTLVVLGDAEDRLVFDDTGYARMADNAGRVVYRKSGAFYGIELSPALIAP